MVITVLKSEFPRQQPKVIFYRNYKNFDKLKFKEELSNIISAKNIAATDFKAFHSRIIDIVNTFAPLKRKYIRANHSSFITKELSKAIMCRSKLRNQFLAKKNEESRIQYNKQRNICVSLLRKAKRKYFDNLKLSDVCDNKKFWKVVKPLFSNKVKARNTITLMEENVLITDELKLANIFNDFFVNIVANLGITTQRFQETDMNNPIIKAISHRMAAKNTTFSFKDISQDKIESIIKKLDPKKAIKSNDIPTKIIKEFNPLFAEFLTRNFNACLNEGIFPEDLKCSEVVPIYKKKDRRDKNNYRPVSILSNISKIYERCMQEQIDEYFHSILSKFQCGFRRGFSAQHCLLVMIEKFRKIRDQKGVFAAVLTDLSKAFDCIPHNLLIAKLRSYGFDEKSLVFISAYLKDRKQKVKIGSAFSDYLNVIFGVPQGSILGPILFIIFIADLFFIIDDLDYASYGDDTTPYVCKKNMTEAMILLEAHMNKIFMWFEHNGLIANSSKSHLLVGPFENINLRIEDSIIKSSSSEELLGITIDSDLSFSDHISTLCAKANQKLSALARVVKYMSLDKRKLLMNSYISAQFNYCPLVWMSHSRSLNNKINKIHERALRLVYEDYGSSFKDLLVKDRSCTIHERNIQYLAIEIFKVKIGVSPEIMSEIFRFEENNTYKLRSGSHLRRTNTHTVHYGLESVSTLGAKIWSLIPETIKASKSLQIFKRKIKKWIPEHCPCRICKTYVSQIGFIN